MTRSHRVILRKAAPKHVYNPLSTSILLSVSAHQCPYILFIIKNLLPKDWSLEVTPFTPFILKKSTCCFTFVKVLWTDSREITYLSLAYHFLFGLEIQTSFHFDT